MEAQEIDRAGFPGSSAGDLDSRHPASALETGGYGPGQRSMVLIEEPLDLPPSPAGRNIELGIECMQHTFERAEREPVAVATLDQRDCLLAANGPLGEVKLPPSAVAPQRANDPSKPYEVHERSIYLSDHPSIHSSSARASLASCW